MPIYDYKCTNEVCNHELEKLQKLSDPALTSCPACQKDSLQKQLTASHFQLKGTGWYKTDFKNK